MPRPGCALSGGARALAAVALVGALASCGGDEEGASGAVGGEAGAAGATAGTAGTVSAGGAPGAGGAGGSSSPTEAGVDAGPDCAPKGGAIGLTDRTLQVGPIERNFLVYAPATLDTSRAAPVVFVHHGFSMSGEIMRELTGFTSLADEKGFIVVFPNGVLTTWDQGGVELCGLGAFSPGSADDFGFVAAMVDLLDAEHCIDRTRVFTTGFSMGGYFSNHIACRRPDLVRAVAPHSGGGPPANCVEPKPVMILHGTLDAIIIPLCGSTARDLWVRHNGCSTEVDVTPVKGGKCEWSKGCPPNGQVVLCTFDGMIHGWAGHDCGPPTCLLPYGGGPLFEDATRLVWDFFEAQSG